jgi:transposase
VPSNLPIDGHSFRRVEVLTGTPRRRRRNDAEKAAIVAESLAPGAVTSVIALRHGLHRNQLYGWRREFRSVAVADAGIPASAFVPVVGESHAGSGTAAIEVEIGGAICGSDRALIEPFWRGAAPVEGAGMIPALATTPPAGVRVLIATRPVDFRRGADGLAATVQSVLHQDPFCGTIVVFRSKRADRVKMLVYDGTGLVLIWKRLNGARFKWPAISDGVMRLSAAQLAALFEGLDWRRVYAPRITRPKLAG